MFPLKARVLNKLAYPIRNHTLTVRIESWTASSPDYDFCNHILTNNATLEGVRYAEICTFELEGQQVVTDADGIATFFELRFTRGVSGLVILEISLEACGGYLAGACSDPIVRNVSLGVQLLSGATNLKSLTSAPISLLTDTLLSSENRPLALVTDSSGAPRSGVSVVAFSASNISQFGARIHGELLRKPSDFVLYGTHPSRPGDAPKIAVLRGAVSVTDSRGVADFASLRVIAANRSAVSIAQSPHMWLSSCELLSVSMRQL